MSYFDDEHYDNKNNDFDGNFNEYDENDNPLICKQELITLTLSERQDATWHMFNLFERILREDEIDFIRCMTYSNFNSWFIHHFESDLVD
jgi:hypothetical protein